MQMDGSAITHPHSHQTDIVPPHSWLPSHRVSHLGVSSCQPVSSTPPSVSLKYSFVGHFGVDPSTHYSLLDIFKYPAVSHLAHADDHLL